MSAGIRKERRRAPRFDVSLEIRYVSVGIVSVESKASTINLSQNGMRFQINSAVQKGSKLNLDISLPGEEKPIKATGKVVWAKELVPGGGGIEAGIQFLSMDPEDKKKLDAFIKTLGNHK